MSDYFKQTEARVMPVLKQHNKIGIMFSGGLDSSTLTWCILKLVQDNKLDNKITLYTTPRPDNSLVHSQKIKEILQADFGIKLKHKARGDSNLPHNQQVPSGLQYAVAENDQVFIAENRQPEQLQTEHFTRIRMDEPERKVSQPFFDETKDFIVGLAIECGLTDIMEYTHSCTETPDIRCGVCWWCQERAWAFEQHNYTDPGRY